MQKVSITLTLDDWKLQALEFYLKEQNTTIQKKLDETMGQLYEQMVPEVVRQFVEGVNGTKPKPKPKVPAPKPQASQKPKPEAKEELAHGQP